MKTFFLRCCLLGMILAAFSAAQAEFQEQTHQRGDGYGEIILITGGPFSFTGHVYKTLFLNDFPEAQWKALDPQKLKKEFHAHAVVLNGPRYALMDHSWIMDPGKIVSFDGLQARFLTDVTIPASDVLSGGSRPYTEQAANRTTRYLFKKGRPIYELISPQGTHYVMISYCQIVDPNLSQADLATLGSRLSLPVGWRYQTKILNHDEILQTSGTAYVIQDNLKNGYQRK
ncbi:MAG: hypothetical protein K2W99_05165 [Chthoniobacterales bacterium]|nr:hypothetical protein [Chthoniobacterales bacterium]